MMDVIRKGFVLLLFLMVFSEVFSESRGAYESVSVLSPKRQVLFLPPQMVEIEVSNFCNLKCTICRRGNADYVQEPIKNMSFWKFKRIIDAYDYPLDFIQFCGTCEPLFNPDLEKMIRYVKDQKSPERIELITNATLFNDRRIDDLISSGLTDIRISIDASDEATYERIRKNGKFSLVKENIARLTASIRIGNQNIRVWFNCVFCRSNRESIVNMPLLANELGVQVLEIRLFETNLEQLNEEEIYNLSELKSVKEVLEKRCKELKIDLILWGFEARKVQECNLKSEAHIDHQGRLTPCYHLPEMVISKPLGKGHFSRTWDKVQKLHGALEFPFEECNCLRAIMEVKKAA